MKSDYTFKAGVPGDIIKGEMSTLETRRSDLLGQLETAPLPPPDCTPALLKYTGKKSSI
jgi:hypothetical protein